ncbi:MAG: sigma-70 family RNA polymerase sigma factor [Nitrospira sp.]|nr:sigma-70 family RNA polymerase sigma factor [Nitrospira sp.]
MRRAGSRERFGAGHVSECVPRLREIPWRRSNFDMALCHRLAGLPAHAAKTQRAPDRELSLEEFIPTSDGEFRLQIPIDGLSPEEALQNKELRHALDAAIDQLPKKYKMVLVLRDMEGLSAKEVGTIMGLNERAVKSRLHRARLFVRRQLSAQGLGQAEPEHEHALLG